MSANERAIGVLKGCACAVVGVYGVALCYRVGLFARILPKQANDAIEAKVERLKSMMEPRSGSAQFTIARQHLLTTYGYSAVGFVLAGAGVGLFFKHHYLPIGAAMAATIVPALALQVFPAKWIPHAGRCALFAVSSIACGYTMGPINWIACDTMKPMGLILASTLAGASIPLFLTRGIVSYFFSSQLLSCSLAIATSGFCTTKTLDVNVMLVVQLIGNAALGIMHTVPVIRKCVQWKGPLDALEDDLDALLDAFHIDSNAAYGCWYLFRVVCTALMYRITRDDKHTKGASREERSYIRTFASMTLNVDRWSNALASLLFVVFYIRVVSFVQRESTVKRLDGLRTVFARLSPFSIAG